MTDAQPIRDVVIVGGGTAGWMAAATLSRAMNNGVTRVTLVESEEIGTVGVGEATIPPIINFNQMLGINENEFLAEVGGTFKLGIEFVDWGALGERYFHPFGRFGHDLQGVHFHQLWLRQARRQPMPDITAFSMSATAARMGKFGRAAEGAQSPVRELFYAFHFDAALYARYLRRYAEAGGVARIEGRVTAVAQDEATGQVEAVLLADGRRIEGDLFIDCSGFRSLLLGEALGVPFQSWQHWLPCDRAVAVPCALPGEPDPFTRSTAREAGWQWRIPLQHRMGNGYVYSSAHLSDEAAERTLMASLEGEPIASPRRLSFAAGMRQRQWEGNVVALGLAGGFLEPLESTSIHLVQAALLRLLALFPDRRLGAAERDEFNRQMVDLYEDARDFIILHYHLTRRTDSPFWDHCRTMPLPEKLARRIALFANKGRLFRENYELFSTPSWVAVCLGQGLIPAAHEPVVDALDERKVAVAMEQMLRGYQDTGERLPSHGDFLRRILGVAAPTPQPPTPEDVPFFSFEAESPLAPRASPI